LQRNDVIDLYEGTLKTRDWKTRDQIARVERRDWKTQNLKV